MTNETNYELTDFDDGTVLDTGRFRYDGLLHHLTEHHKGMGMMHDVLRNSFLDEYLSCTLVEHVDSITDDELKIYIHDFKPGTNWKGYAYDTTPAFCITDDGEDSLGALKPCMVLRCFGLEQVDDDFPGPDF